MEKKIAKLLHRLAELEEVLGQPHIYEDQKRYRNLTQEHAHLSRLQSVYNQQKTLQSQLSDNQEMLKQESDPEFNAVLREDILILESRLQALQGELDNLLVPPDPNDHRPTILEIRAGTGGDEAALFVGDCVRMYKLYADKHSWNYELLSCTPSEIGGFKDYVMVFSGANVHRYLQYESGTHRVQRVPKTETQGRIHTSAITIAVLLEPEENEAIEIDERELRIDTYRSSGAGGQHVNTTDSAVRITHMPSGIVVYCQEERSQHKNKDKALRLLQAKLSDFREQKLREEIASTRALQVGSGDRSERIRTYNFPQNRLTDHRINLTKYNLDQIMNGDLEEVTLALVAHFHHQKLNAAETT